MMRVHHVNIIRVYTLCEHKPMETLGERLKAAREAAGTVTTGNLSTWVWVSTNRHLTKVVDDLASAHALSVAAE